MIGKGGQQVGAIIMVAGHQVIGHGQALQLRAQHGVFVRVAEVHQVTADEHDIRAWLAGVQVLDRAAQRRQGIDHPVTRLAAGLEVQVADLRDDEGRSVGDDIRH